MFYLPTIFLDTQFKGTTILPLQVKIWFQNRRAKERKQVKKREELEQKELKAADAVPNSPMANLTIGGLAEMGGMLGYEPDPPSPRPGPSSHPLL